MRCPFFSSLSLFFSFCLSCSLARSPLPRTATSKSSGGFAATLFYSQHNPDISERVCGRESNREKESERKREWGEDLGMRDLRDERASHSIDPPHPLPARSFF